METEHIPEALPLHSLHMGRTQKVLVAGKKSIFGGNKEILRGGQSRLPGPCPARGNLIQWYSRSLHVLQTLEAIGSQTQFAGASQKQPERSVSLGSVPVSVNEPQDWPLARGRLASLTAVSCPWMVGNQLKWQPIKFRLL